MIGTLKRPFDSKKHAVRIAKVEGLKTKQVLADWANRGKVAMKKGTKIHKFIEQRLKDKEPKFKEYLPEMAAWDRWYSANVFEPVLIEQPIYDTELNVAGTLDALFYSWNGSWSNTEEEYIPIDWKTGITFSVNGFETLKKPFEDLEDCNLVMYSLQLSLYKLILQRTTDYDLGDGFIIHLTKNGEYRQYPTLNFCERLQDWLIST